ncbi:hypothetical protein C2G38_1402078 [Gigaspora rosea]|uniref:Uncharacterized protein n=1 Tax=Gigaspora rosea TaxID=44941 RepID=A0A397V772_9GLOM|nr:hypothetical protein C2G38_1402078 [Gigaspora rosea]
MAEDVVFTVKGELNLMAKTPVGDIKMEKIQFNFDKNFKYQTQPRILMKSMETVKATRDTIEFKGLATIINPLNVEIELRSNVEFDLLSDQNIKVANMTIENFKLKRKNEDMVVKLKYLPEYDSGHSVIQNYLNRRFSILSIKTNNQTTSVFLLQKFFEVLELKVLLPGIDALFLKEIEVSLNTKHSFTLHNPFKTKIYFFSLNSKVINIFNRQIATAIIEPRKDGIIIESGKTKKIQIDGCRKRNCK